MIFGILVAVGELGAPLLAQQITKIDASACGVII